MNERHNLFSLFAGFNYDYADKYLIGATIRRDGSSRFGDENEYGIFPSATLGWRVSNENFLKESEFLTNLLFRASWGVVGNERIGNYLFTGALELGMLMMEFRVSPPLLGWVTPPNCLGKKLNLSTWVWTYLL